MSGKKANNKEKKKKTKIQGSERERERGDEKKQKGPYCN